MDNIIEWLVVLFFIISFLNSILKPKKTNQKQTPADSRDRVITSGPTVDAPDLRTELEEVLGQRKREYEKKKETLKTEFEKKYSEGKTFEKKQAELSIRSKIKSTERTYEKQAPVHEIKEKKPLESASALGNLLSDPASARKAVLLSEILGKPKALKRKW